MTPTCKVTRSVLPNEVLHEILRCLARRFLDCTEITSRRLNLLINARLEEHALRSVTMLVLNEDFISFNVLNEALFERLLPYAACLRESVCRVPTKYASQELVTRAFSELFFAREIHVGDRLCVADSDDIWGYAGTFVGLPSVQHCQMLVLSDVDLFFRIRGQLDDWLCSGGPKKTFVVRLDVRSVPLYFVGLSRLILRRFHADIVAAEFELIIIALRDVKHRLTDFPSMKVTNERTGEVLSVKSKELVVRGQDYVRVSYNRRSQGLLGA